MHKVLSITSFLITICLIYMYDLFLLQRQLWQHISMIALFISLFFVDYIVYSKINKKITVIYLIIQTILGLVTIYTSICINTEDSILFFIAFIIAVTCPKIVFKMLIIKDNTSLKTIANELSLISFFLYYISNDYNYLIIKVLGVIILLLLAIVLFICFYDRKKIVLLIIIVVQTSATIVLLMISNRNIALNILFFVAVFTTVLIFEKKSSENERIGK